MPVFEPGFLTVPLPVPAQVRTPLPRLAPRWWSTRTCSCCSAGGRDRAPTLCTSQRGSSTKSTRTRPPKTGKRTSGFEARALIPGTSVCSAAGALPEVSPLARRDWLAGTGGAKVWLIPACLRGSLSNKEKARHRCSGPETRTHCCLTLPGRCSLPCCSVVPKGCQHHPSALWNIFGAGRNLAANIRSA